MARPQAWRSLGHVHVARGESPHHMTHGSYPTPLVMPDGTVRVFYSPRDAQGRSTIYALDIALSADGFTRLGEPSGPWLLPGPGGAFDDAGASVSWVGWLPDGSLDCWFLGWSLAIGMPPFRSMIGRAIAAPGACTMERVSFAPVIDRDAMDPLSLTYPWVLRKGSRLQVWYGAHRHPATGGRLPVDHVIRRAVSDDDGLSWRRDVGYALDHLEPEEWALNRPWIVIDDDGWHMWLCRRFDKYRLGYAHSPDGRKWTRADAAIGFTTPEAEWEAGSRTYPSVLDHAGRRFMFYNGTGYGRSGFGVAVLEPG